MNITVKQIEFRSAVTGQNVCGWIYTPNTPLRAVVQICHGMAEHMGRYHEFMRYLAQNGYAACGIDQLGHGCSVEEEAYGFFAEQDGWHILVDNQYKFNKIIRSELPGRRVVLFGHSMGSFIARIYASKYPLTLDGLILSGTARSGIKIEMAIQLANRSAQKNGSHYIDRNLSKLAIDAFNEPFRDEKNRFAWLSSDRKMTRQFEEDVKCGFVFTASAFRDLFILLRNASQKKCFESTPQLLPILIFSGSLDPVGECGRGPRQVYAQYLKAGVADVELMLYENGRHEMLNETNREQVYEEVRGWLDAHFPEWHAPEVEERIYED